MRRASFGGYADRGGGAMVFASTYKLRQPKEDIHVWKESYSPYNGNLLALSGASLPQWTGKMGLSQRRWINCHFDPWNASRRTSVILGERGVGLDLEILARGTRKQCSASPDGG